VRASVLVQFCTPDLVFLVRDTCPRDFLSADSWRRSFGGFAQRSLLGLLDLSPASSSVPLGLA
jgi:hypothetical protein